MKELQTNLGIECMAEIVSVNVFGGVLSVFVESQFEDTTIDVKFDGLAESDDYSELLAGDTIEPLNKWVNMVTVGHLSKKLAEKCVELSDNETYYDFHISAFKTLYTTVTKFRFDGNNCQRYTSVGLENTLF